MCTTFHPSKLSTGTTLCYTMHFGWIEEYTAYLRLAWCIYIYIYKSSIPIKKYYFILSIWMFYLHACLYNMCVHGSHGSQERKLGPQELELWTVVSCNVGSGNWTQICYKSSQFSLPMSNFSKHKRYHFKWRTFPAVHIYEFFP